MPASGSGITARSSRKGQLHRLQNLFPIIRIKDHGARTPVSGEFRTIHMAMFHQQKHGGSRNVTSDVINAKLDSVLRRINSGVNPYLSPVMTLHRRMVDRKQT